MPLTIGTRLGQYEVVGLLGAGGMGEVYRARDRKLGRDVAIKALPRGASSDPQRLRRFEKEARAASALNHPNIVTIHEVGEFEDGSFIVMEYVAGRTLREILQSGALPTDRLLRYARQLAEGLTKAHQAGIVHRDLKPGNIIVTDDDYIKILDFGLAKLHAPAESEGPDVATVTGGLTTPGTIVGTVGYMSPEQVKARPADHRSDQFSLGAVLYEMAGGFPAFKAASTAETLSSVLRDEPPPLHRSVPVRFRELVRRCLAKAPEQRFDSTSLIVEALADVTDRPSPVSGRTTRLRSIAILPLRDLNPKPGEEYFADGMTEALTTELAKIRDLKVISRTSAMRFKGTDKPLPTVARELGAEVVVEGSVLRAGNRVRISGQLIDASTDEHVWAESYERDLQDILRLQSDVACAIALGIQASLTADELSRLEHRPRVNPAAHEAYQRGRYQHDNWNFEDAIGNFQRAIEIDPKFALAHSGLALAYVLLGVFGFGRPDQIAPLAKASALKALEFDPSLAEARSSLATVRYVYDWDWAAAEADLREAKALAPNSIDSLLAESFIQTTSGRFEVGIAAGRRACEIDPLTPTTASHLGYLLFFARRYDESMEQCQKTLEFDPELHYPNITLAWIAAKKNSPRDVAREAQATLAKMPREDPFALGGVGWALGKVGLHDQARALLVRLKKLKGRWLDPSWAAYIHEALGETDDALECWNLAREQRSPNMVHLRNHPLMDDLRTNPDFEKLRDRMAFPD